MKQFLVLNPKANVLIIVGEAATGKSFLAQHTSNTKVHDDIYMYDQTLAGNIWFQTNSKEARLQIIICNNITVATQYYDHLLDAEVRQ